MKFALLASGSKGNCCVIKTDDTQIIIDCGCTKRYLNECFVRLKYDYEQADALLITHSHSDHIAQLKMFDQIPTYAPEEIKTSFLTTIKPFDEFDVKNIHIVVLPMSHDAPSTVGYVLTWEDKKMVYITDTGYIKEEIKPFIQNADYYIFESNHDIEMLMQTNRPIFLKQRIINDNGHLCNDDASQILSTIIGDKTKEIILAHISQEGNTRELALNTLRKTLIDKNINCDHLKLYASEQFNIYIGGN